MNAYKIKVQRSAEATLEVELNIRAESQEQAEATARFLSEQVLTADAFTVANLDLTASEGSSEVIAE